MQMLDTNTIGVKEVFNLLSSIPDPEIPVITIADLGVLRKVEEINNQFVITITPTYSGCPALHAMQNDIESVLREHHISNFKIITTLFPAWTTDWMTQDTKKKLEQYGIAPPQKIIEHRTDKNVTCPFCQSTHTVLTSWFGSTACKSLHYCNGCHQPFEEFKCH